MAKNIQLELLAKFGQDLTSKRIFLYEADPSKEPVYITIEDLTKQLNELLGSNNKTLNDFITDLTKLELKVAKYNDTINDISTASTNAINTVNELRATVNGISTRIDELSTEINTNSSSISGLDSRITSAETLLNNIKTTIDAIKPIVEQMQNHMSSTNEALASMEWQTLS